MTNPTVTKVLKNAPYPVDGFSETVQWVLLQCTNVDGNNNKFYCMEIQHNQTTGEYRIYSEYGRLGNSPARDLRNGLTLESAQKEFARIQKGKERLKTRKSAAGTYKEKYVAVDVPAPSVGSPNICLSVGSTTKRKINGGISANVFSQMDYDDETQRLLNQLLDANVHNIETKTSITVSRTGQLETAVGAITVPHIIQAKSVLNELMDIEKLDPSNPIVRDLNTKYFSMVPRQFGRTIDESDMILDDNRADEEFDLLSGMEAAIKVGNKKQTADSPKPDLGLDMQLVTEARLSNKIIKQFESTRKHTDVANWKPKRVFGVFNKNEQRVYKLPTDNSDEFDLFHGSANSNILSILMNGYYVPPRSASHVTGRMFGNGVYGASSSTKAFRYSVGLWGQNRSANRAYCLVVRFAMGNIYSTSSSKTGGAPSGYHSIHAKAGHSLLNDEYIVYNTSQTKNLYLIELEKR